MSSSAKKLLEDETRDWYAQRSPFAARGFLLELTDAVQAVVEAR
jgi:hypothetical protein